jgi:hypothetical protein
MICRKPAELESKRQTLPEIAQNTIPNALKMNQARAAVFAAHKELLEAMSGKEPIDSNQIHPAILLDIAGGAECGTIRPLAGRDWRFSNEPPQW